MKSEEGNAPDQVLELLKILGYADSSRSLVNILGWFLYSSLSDTKDFQKIISEFNADKGVLVEFFYDVAGQVLFDLSSREREKILTLYKTGTAKEFQQEVIRIQNKVSKTIEAIMELQQEDVH